MASPPPAKPGPRKDSARRRSAVLRPIPGPPVSTTRPGSASAAVAAARRSPGRSAGWSPAAPSTDHPSPLAGTNMGSCAGRIFVVWIPHRTARGHPTPGRDIMSDGYDGDTGHDSYSEHDHNESHDHYESHDHNSHGSHEDPYGHGSHEDPSGATVVTADFGPD